MSQSLETQTERKTTINKFFQEGIKRKRKVVKEKKMLNLNGHKGKKFSLQLAIEVILKSTELFHLKMKIFYYGKSKTEYTVRQILNCLRRKSLIFSYLTILWKICFMESLFTQHNKRLSRTRSLRSFKSIRDEPIIQRNLKYFSSF